MEQVAVRATIYVHGTIVVVGSKVRENQITTSVAINSDTEAMLM